MRKSVDGGRTWGSVIAIAGDDNTTGGYIAPIVDSQRQTVILLYNRRFSEVWITKSIDSGKSFSKPLNITSETGPLALGPPGGVQLASGRLAQAVHSSVGTFALLSDDGGVTWRHGSPVPFASGVVNGGEAQLIGDNRGNNTVTMLIRVSSSDVLRNHAIAQSGDDGDTWSSPAQVVQAVTGPTCQGSIAQLPSGDILLSAPHFPHWHSPEDRRNLTVWKFSPNNVTKSIPLGQISIFSGPAAYSSLSVDGQYILFEGGQQYRYASVLFAPVLF